jgi:hypothetical protein
MKLLAAKKRVANLKITLRTILFSFGIFVIFQMCGECLRCKSCNLANVLHFDEEDSPLCDQCCLQKKKGSYCPLCEGCYDDNDYETRMMECAQCGGWIHAKCEDMDAEKYQILSYLPNSIDYVCK